MESLVQQPSRGPEIVVVVAAAVLVVVVGNTRQWIFDCDQQAS